MSHQHETQCQHILENLSAYLDGELDATCCEEIETHLQSCRDCQIVAGTLKETIHLCQAEGRDVRLPRAARTRLFDRLGLDNGRKDE